MNTKKKHYLTDGEFIVTSVPMEVHTVLGSCVSVCLWDSSLSIAGMNHYLMPGTADEEIGSPNHGYSSIRMLIRSLINRGSIPGNIEAKVFGGASSLKPLQSSVFSIGAKNIKMAHTLLNEWKIRITAEHTGGDFGRKIIFDTGTGKVKMKKLNKRAEDINEQVNKGFNC